MMTPNEWAEIVEWVDQRWPDGWNPEQAVAFHDDLRDFDTSDVWGGLYAFYNAGQVFPPTGSQLVNLAREERRRAAVEDRYDQPALPDPVEKPVESWLNKWYPNEQVSWDEHIRRVHRKKGPCGSRFCDIHLEVPA